MPDVFMSHAEENFHEAYQLALRLETQGFSTWYYERDVVPGPSYLEQSRLAIDGSQAVLVLISSQSLETIEVTRDYLLLHR